VPGLPTRVCPHPLYDDYPAAAGSLPRRAGLELLFFGLVRPYKGLDLLLDALALCPDVDLHLSIVGEFWSGLDAARERIARAGLESRVELVPRHVSDAEAAEYFARADALVAPYRAASGSGVLALAQWYGVPVIASDVAGLAEAVDDGRTGWLFPAGDAQALADVLRHRASRAAAQAMAGELAALRDSLTWRRLAEAVLQNM
jgi:glycosyltransferase involved in cell wall biosynthesis